MIPPEWILSASHRISPYIVHTPVIYDPELQVYLKWENQQHTGSFKLRGALNKVLSLKPWEIEKGVVAASAGNHGAGLAFACKQAGGKALIFVPDSAPLIKLNKIRALGAEVALIAGGYTATEDYAIQYAKEHHQTFISPYNDAQVIAGQGTLALETIRDLSQETVKAWVVPVGGGGLISGIGAALESYRDTSIPSPLLIGVQSEASPYMEQIYYTGVQDQVVELPSIADGLSGAVEPHSITIPLVKKYVDQILLVSEDEIHQAIRYAWDCYHQVIEGSAAVVLAAILSAKIIHRPALLVISGGNIDPQLHQRIVDREI
ncbi:MAG: threonine ammonia-lyase [Anaerolineales bacterium]